MIDSIILSISLIATSSLLMTGALFLRVHLRAHLNSQHLLLNRMPLDVTPLSGSQHRSEQLRVLALRSRAQ